MPFVARMRWLPRMAAGFQRWPRLCGSTPLLHDCCTVCLLHSRAPNKVGHDKACYCFKDSLFFYDSHQYIHVDATRRTVPMVGDAGTQRSNGLRTRRAIFKLPALPIHLELWMQKTLHLSACSFWTLPLLLARK